MRRSPTRPAARTSTVSWPRSSSQNFTGFGEFVAKATGQPLRNAQRRTVTGETPLDSALLEDVDTLIVISVDGQRTGQSASPAEVAAVRAFLARPDAMLFVCPHHDIGDTEGLDGAAAQARLVAEFHHHGDVAGARPTTASAASACRSWLLDSGAPIRKPIWSLQPQPRTPSGDPTPFVCAATDRFGMLTDVPYLNLHAHLPHYERIGAAAVALEVLARLEVDPDAPPHPVMPAGALFDAMLQASPDAGLGRLVVCDMTLWASTFGGLAGLQAFWKNVVAA